MKNILSFLVFVAVVSNVATASAPTLSSCTSAALSTLAGHTITTKNVILMLNHGVTSRPVLLHTGAAYTN